MERKLTTWVGVTEISACGEKVLAQADHSTIGATYGAGYGLLDHLQSRHRRRIQIRE